MSLVKRYAESFAMGAGEEALKKVSDISKLKSILGGIDVLTTGFAKDFIVNPGAVRREMDVKMRAGNRRLPELLRFEAPTPAGEEPPTIMRNGGQPFPILEGYRPDTESIFRNQIEIQGIGTEFGSDALTTAPSSLTGTLPSTIRGSEISTVLGEPPTQLGVPVGSLTSSTVPPTEIRQRLRRPPTLMDSQPPPNLRLFVPPTFRPVK